jgi:hypothetical protein
MLPIDAASRTRVEAEALVALASALAARPDPNAAERFMRRGRALLCGRWLETPRSSPACVAAAAAALFTTLLQRSGGDGSGVAPLLKPLVVLVEMVHAAASEGGDPLAAALALVAAAALCDSGAGAPLRAVVVGAGRAILDPAASGLAALGARTLSSVRFVAARCALALVGDGGGGAWPATVLELVRRSLAHDVLCPPLLWAPGGWDAGAALAAHNATRLAVAPIWTRALVVQLRVRCSPESRSSERDRDSCARLVARVVDGALESAQALHRGALHARATWVGIGAADPGAAFVEGELAELASSAFLAHALLLHGLLCGVLPRRAGAGEASALTGSVCASAALALAHVAWGAANANGAARRVLEELNLALDDAAALRADALVRVAASLAVVTPRALAHCGGSAAAAAIVAARLGACCAMLHRWGAAHSANRAVSAAVLPQLHRIARWHSPRAALHPASGGDATFAATRRRAHGALQTLLGLARPSGGHRAQRGSSGVDTAELAGYAHLCAASYPSLLSSTTLAAAVGNVLDALDAEAAAACARFDGAARGAALAAALASIDALCAALRERLARRELAHAGGASASALSGASPCRDLALVLFHSLKHVPLSTLPLAWARCCTLLTCGAGEHAQRDALVELLRHAVVHSGGATQAHKEWLLPRFVRLHGEVAEMRVAEAAGADARLLRSGGAEGASL